MSAETDEGFKNLKEYTYHNKRVSKLLMILDYFNCIDKIV